jgi:uncharacterized membrane protein YwaF
MEQDNHKHKMVRSQSPAVQQAKALCFIVIAAALGCYWFYLQSPPATRVFIDAYSTWPCIIIGTIVALVALRAVFSR